MSIVDRQHPTRVRFTDAQGLPEMMPMEGSTIRFQPIPKITLADCCNLKTAGVDNTDRLCTLLSQLGESIGEAVGDYECKELLAEFQYAFVTFLMGHVYEGFEQWKRLNHLLCSCQQALTTYQQLYNDLLMALHFQLKECGVDFFEDALANDNFLITTLALLFANIEDHAGEGTGLRTRGAKFRMLVEKRFKRSFELPDDTA